FLLNDGVAGDERILPEGWIEHAASPKTIDGKQVDYRSMLRPLPEAAGTPNHAAFAARRIFGKHGYMNPAESVVIVVWGALPKPQGMAPIKDNDFFAAAGEALKR